MPITKKLTSSLFDVAVVVAPMIRKVVPVEKCLGCFLSTGADITCAMRLGNFWLTLYKCATSSRSGKSIVCTSLLNSSAHGTGRVEAVLLACGETKTYKSIHCLSAHPETLLCAKLIRLHKHHILLKKPAARSLEV